MIKINFILDQGAAGFERQWPAVPRVGDGIYVPSAPGAGVRRLQRHRGNVGGVSRTGWPERHCLGAPNAIAPDGQLVKRYHYPTLLS